MELPKDTDAVNYQQQPKVQRRETEYHMLKVFFRMILQGKLKQAIGWVTGCDKGGILLLKDTDEKIWKKSAGVLAYKHPSLTLTDVAEVPQYDVMPTLMDIGITEDIVKQVAKAM